MSASLKMTGIGELMGKLDALGAIAGRKVLTAVARKAMKPVHQSALQKVAVDRGALKASIRLATVKPKSSNVVASAGISIRGPGAHRWHFEEFGTRRQKARPFLRPAFAQHQQAILTSITELLAKAIHQATKRQYRRGGTIALSTTGSSLGLGWLPANLRYEEGR